MSFKNIMINCVKPEYTAKYIANTMLSKEIAKINSITLIPQISNSDIYQIAYIDIESYCDTEEAYAFIKNLKNGSVMFYHNDMNSDDVWIIENNTHNSGGLCVGPYTTNFCYDEDDNKSEINTEYNESVESNYDEEFELSMRQRPIQGIGIDRYTIDEAICHLDFLHERLNMANSHFDRQQILEEIFHLDNELRIQYTIQNSSNVTLRSDKVSRIEFQENQNLSREMSSMLRTNLFRSLSDLPV